MKNQTTPRLLAGLICALGMGLAACAPWASVPERPATAGSTGPVATTPAPPAVVDSDGDGVPDSADRCPNSRPGSQNNAMGCTLEAQPATTGSATDHGRSATAQTASRPRPSQPRAQAGAPISTPSPTTSAQAGEAPSAPQPAEQPATTPVSSEPPLRDAVFVEQPIDQPVRRGAPATLQFAISFDLDHAQLRARLGWPTPAAKQAGGGSAGSATSDSADGESVLHGINLDQVKYIQAQVHCIAPLGCTPISPASGVAAVKPKGAMQWSWSLEATEDRKAASNVTVSFAGGATREGPFDIEIQQLPPKVLQVAVEHPDLAFLDWLKLRLDKSYEVLVALGLLGGLLLTWWARMRGKKPAETPAG